jgi:O-antigen ligase
MLLRIFFVIWFFLLNLGQLTAVFKVSFGGFYLFDIFAVLWVFIALLTFLVDKKKEIHIPKEYFLIIGFLSFGLVSLILALQNFTQIEMVYSFFYYARFVVYILAGALVYNCFRARIFSERFIFNLISLSVGFISLAGFIQLIVLPDFTVLDSSLGWDPHKNRLASTFFDPNFTGAYLVLCLNFLVVGKDYLKKKFVPLVLLIVFSVLLTFSRSAWLMLAVSIFIWGIFKYRLLLILSFLVAFSAYFAVPRVQTRISGITDPADSAHFRLISWRKTWEIARDNLVFGTGFNTFRFAQKDYGFFGAGWGGHSGGGSDSSLLLVLATTGIPGFLLFFSFFGVLFVEALKNLSNRWSIVLLASLGGLFMESFFINSLFYPQILFLWLLLLGVFRFNLFRK